MGCAASVRQSRPSPVHIDRMAFCITPAPPGIMPSADLLTTQEIVSNPVYGRSTSGTLMLPSAC